MAFSAQGVPISRLPPSPLQPDLSSSSPLPSSSSPLSPDTTAPSISSSAVLSPSPPASFSDGFLSHQLAYNRNTVSQFLLSDRVLSSTAPAAHQRHSSDSQSPSAAMVDSINGKPSLGLLEPQPPTAQMLEQKRQEHEIMRQEHIRRFEQEMHLLAEQQRKDEQMILQMAAQEAENGTNTATTISEPTTPPDFRDTLSPSTTVGGDRIRSNTVPVGVAGLVTPNGALRMPGQQLMTPPEDAIPRARTLTSTSLGPSRRLSNDDPMHYGLGQINTTKFLFGDDSASSAQANELKFNDDKFPILVRRESFNQTSAAPPSIQSSAQPQQPAIISSAQQQHSQQQQVWQFINRRPGHQHSLSNVALPYPESQHDRRSSVDIPASYQLFSGPGASKPSFPHEISHSRQASHRSVDSDRRDQSFSRPKSPLPVFHEGISPAPSSGVYPYQIPPVMPYSYPYYRGAQQPATDGAYTSATPTPPVQVNHQHSLSQSSQPPQSSPMMPALSSSRRQSDQDVNRFANVMLESLTNEIYSLCKDQHGCRYLQKKLEERNPVYLEMIFNETYPHVVELMVDPFGNYLCQKLLEHASDEQRTVLVETAAPQLVKIALNQHGTRALQKMIEHISTPEQIRLIVNALKTNVVELIQDLNGNHVIQKCLNRLSTNDAQFIFDAVSDNCVTVGTHRHGCCVLQRCIDHASDAQKLQLVNQITTHAFTLVQDPFGNYVTQYVLDLCDAKYSDPLIRRFAGNVCTLSMQKFSSNVIEKCIRIAEPSTRKILIDELLSSVFLDKLLRDSFANYVIQTALDYADPQTRQMLVDAIRPILPSIRNTPYGRRIQSKIIGPPIGASPGPNVNGSPFAGYPRNGPNASTNVLARRMQGLDLKDSSPSPIMNGNFVPQMQNHQRQQQMHHHGQPQYAAHPSVHQQPYRNSFTTGEYGEYNYM